MTKRSPTYSEESLRFMEMRHGAQQYSYDLTQRLTFFVISIELIFCGYILLNFEKLGVIKFSSILFLLSGAAAGCGILWRFCYNQTYHDNAHGKHSGKLKFLNWAQTYSYRAYVALTIAFLLGIVGTGYEHINRIEKGNIQIEDKNKTNIQMLSDGIKGIQDSLNNISSSIEKLAKIDPKVEVIVLPSDVKKNITDSTEVKQ